MADDAWGRADRLVEAVDAQTFSELLDGFAEALGARVHFVADDDGLQELTRLGHAGEKLRALAEFELDHRGCDAIVLRSTPDRPRDDHLIVVDARGDRWWRAYFSAWHEVAHLLVGLEAHPNSDDPDFDANFGALERAVDQLAAHLAFHPTLFDPLIRRLTPDRELSFAAIERVRAAVHPNASLYATAIACVSRWPQPVQLVGTGSDPGKRQPVLRVKQVTLSETARQAGLRIEPGCEVPAQSIVHQIHGSFDAAEAEAPEDQGWWSTLENRLLALPVRVRAVSRADHTYRPAFTRVTGGGPFTNDSSSTSGRHRPCRTGSRTMSSQIARLRQKVSAAYSKLGKRAIEPFIGHDWLRPDRLRVLGVGINSYVRDADPEPGWFRSWFAEGKHRFYPAAGREMRTVGDKLEKSTLYRGLRYADSDGSAYVTNAVKTYLTAEDGRHAAAVPPDIFDEHTDIWLEELDILARYDALPHAVIVFGGRWWPWAWQSFYRSEKPWIMDQCTRGPLLHRLNRIDVETAGQAHALLLMRVTHPAARTKRWRAQELVNHRDFKRVAELE